MPYQNRNHRCYLQADRLQVVNPAVPHHCRSVRVFGIGNTSAQDMFRSTIPCSWPPANRIFTALPGDSLPKMVMMKDPKVVLIVDKQASMSSSGRPSLAFQRERPSEVRRHIPSLRLPIQRLPIVSPSSAETGPAIVARVTGSNCGVAFAVEFLGTSSRTCLVVPSQIRR